MHTHQLMHAHTQQYLNSQEPQAQLTSNVDGKVVSVISQAVLGLDGEISPVCLPDVGDPQDTLAVDAEIAGAPG